MRKIKPIQPRKYKKTVMLSQSELAALENYCKRYKIENQSALIRQILLNHIYEQFVVDYPTLWSKQELAMYGCL